MIRFLVLALAALVFLGVGCDNEKEYTPPTLTFTVLDDGSHLRVSWIRRTAISEYEVRVDEREYDVYGNSLDITEPGKKITVRGKLDGQQKTDAAGRDFAAVTTEAVTLYSMSDSLNPEHAQHGLRFYAVDGSAHAVAYDDPTRSSVTFVLVDSGDSLFLLSAGDFTYPNGGYWTMWSGKAILAADDFANLKTCPPATANWSNRVRLVAGQTYALDATDNSSPVFVKVKVEAINGKAVTLKTAVQKTWRLRWVVTE